MRERSSAIADAVIEADRAIVCGAGQPPPARAHRYRRERRRILSREHVDNVCRRSAGALRQRQRAGSTAGRSGREQHAVRTRGTILHRQDIRQVR